MSSARTTRRQTNEVRYKVAVAEDPRAADWRRSQRVLSMVVELHKRGYQRLRICPGVSNVGTWRCGVTSIDNIRQLNGAMTVKDDEALVAMYVAPSGNEYFGWKDARDANARDLADLFVERFPTISERGRGRDWPYAGWLLEILGVAEQGLFPVAYRKSDGVTIGGEDRPTALETTAFVANIKPIGVAPPPLIGG